jgi:hypothetical protein
MKLKHLLYFFLLAPLLSSCDLQKDIEVDLPPLVPQLVVEAYLEPGKPYRVAVLETVSYFDDPQPPLVPSAEVFITHNGKRTRLNYKPNYTPRTNRFYTHSAPEIMDGKPGDVYTLEVTDNKGRKVTGSTTILAPIPIDTIEWKFNDKEEAYLLTSFQDDPDKHDFYRFMINRDSLEKGSVRDFVSNDELTNGKRVSFGTAYDFEKGDTLIVSLFHIEKPYYDYISSVTDAKNANGNPFAQPAKVKSSVQGGIGIFTNLAYDRKMVIID